MSENKQNTLASSDTSQKFFSCLKIQMNGDDLTLKAECLHDFVPVMKEFLASISDTLGKENYQNLKRDLSNPCYSIKSRAFRNVFLILLKNSILNESMINELEALSAGNGKEAIIGLKERVKLMVPKLRKKI